LLSCCCSIDVFSYFLCDSSQNGLFDDFPHLQSKISPGEVSVSRFISLITKFPLILKGPNSMTSTIACGLNSFFSSIFCCLSVKAYFSVLSVAKRHMVTYTTPADRNYTIFYFFMNSIVIKCKITLYNYWPVYHNLG